MNEIKPELLAGISQFKSLFIGVNRNEAVVNAAQTLVPGS
jgi:hypothetical protein